MLKMKGKKIITILHSKILLNWSYVLYFLLQVPQHCELSWIFSCMCTVPTLMRMPQWKVSYLFACWVVVPRLFEEKQRDLVFGSPSFRAPIEVDTLWCFGHGLNICMWFGYNPQIIFCYFLCKLNLVIFQALYIRK